MYGLRKVRRNKIRRSSLSGEQRFIACPKCGATRGLHRYASAAQNGSHAEGLSCFMCGYWLEAGSGAQSERRAAMLARKQDSTT